MKKTFAIQVEYPDCDFVSSEEIAEVTQECIDQYLEGYLVENIMDGDYDRIKVKEITDFLSLVKRMREAQNCWWNDTEIFVTDEEVDDLRLRMEQLESEVDEYLKKMDI